MVISWPQCPFLNFYCQLYFLKSTFSSVIILHIEMFQVLHAQCKEAGITIADFCNYETPDKNFPHESILEDLVRKIKWRMCRRKDLFNRIKKLVWDPSFSVRDKKLLKKLVNQQRKKGQEDYESLLYYFPGKTIEMLKEKYNEKISF